MMLTLLSDFGTRDSFVGIAKGILLQQLPNVSIIDLSHEVLPFHFLQCSYYLKSSYAHFPENTVHLSLFDIMHEIPAKLLILKKGTQFILSSDNGLLPLTFPESRGKVYQHVDLAYSYQEWIKNAGIFISQLAKDGFIMPHLQAAEPYKGPHTIEPYENGANLECQVIHVDIYGNVITNLTQENFELVRKNRKFEIEFARWSDITEISADYSSVPEGEKLVLFNSGGFLEIAVNKGSAAQLFGFSVAGDHQLIYQKIIIKFS